MSSIAEIEARRAERKSKLQAEADEQRAKDLEALDALEVEFGDTNIIKIDVPFTPGLPTLAAARTPRPEELKRYRQNLNVTPGEKLDLAGSGDAAAQLGRSVVKYPDVDTFKAMCAARPDLASQLGQLAVKLAQGKAADEGKG